MNMKSSFRTHALRHDDPHAPRQPGRATDDDLLMPVRLTLYSNRRIHEIDTHEVRLAGSPRCAF
jgi:hypothetical protein